MAAHTPTSWAVTRRSGNDWPDVVTLSQEGVSLVIAGVGGWNTEEAKANACLIAAAPDLLAALEELLEWEISMAGLGHPRLDKARAAIAKARGHIAGEEA